ncbi:MAG: methyltransferase domain-containing protein [Candidatus Falkowbacteria bacterium]|nr:methyltransferase domain-containing protein [Candidatus Falkowbacteria bacterium]
MPEIKKNVLFDINNILSKMGIDEKQRVAELGCGNFGFFVFPLARLVGRQGKVYAVDILKPTLEEIRKEAKKNNWPQIITIWSNLEIFKATNIETSSLDSALLINVLHQSEKKIEIMREAIRLLKRGGKLLIVEWKNMDLPLGPAPEKRVKLESLKSAIPKIGLNITEEFEAGPYHYGLVLTKL